MPKRGKGSKSWVRDKLSSDLDDYRSGDFFEHDDRGRESGPRRVSFKSGNRIGKHGRQHHQDAPRLRDAMLYFQDEAMAGDESIATSSRGGGRYNNAPYAGRSGRRGRGGRMGSAPGGPGGRHKLMDQTGWFRIHIPWGAKHAKDYLLGILRRDLAPSELIPIAFRVENQDVVFFVDDMKIAEALQDADRKISVAGGFKLNIRVSPGMPRVDMDDRLKERIKMAMVKRYNHDTKALDLSRFHRDPDLVEDTFCAVSRGPVLGAILDVIGEHIPELVALNLDHNCIFVAEHLSQLPRKAPNLRILYLGFNRFRDLNGFSALKALPLAEIKFEGNPLQRKMDKTDYTSAVRKMFTKLTRLDGTDLPKTIGFDLGEEQPSLPPTQASFLCSDGGRDVARNFVEQYFALFDIAEQGTRQPLLEAYHEQAIFSLTSVYPPSNVLANQGPKLNTYISDSRNLLRVSDPERRQKLLLRGRLGIVSFLSTLPRTQHDPASFTLDLTVFSPHLLVMTLTGVFREPDTKGVPVRHFLRKFVLVPVGAGFCITNEMMFVSNASPAEMKKAFSAPPVPLPSIPDVASQSSSQSLSQSLSQPLSQQSSQSLSQPSQEQSVEALAAQTSMNHLWARKCLDETGWDLQRAVQAFIALNAQGKVPPEAFIK